MNVVGRVGSLISQGVYSVATPFHPFGGAVDIIVVEQEDGTYRSMPWYVRFGKFQGIIKGHEKVVSIRVNGVEADFHMYLDHSGQAYFLREVASSDSQCSEPCSNKSSPHKPIEADSLVDNAEVDDSVSEDHRESMENGEGCRDDQSSPGCSSVVSGGFSPYNYGNLEEVEVMVKSSNESNSEMVLVSVDGHVLTAPISENEEENSDYVQSTNPQFHLGPGDIPENFGGIFSDLDASALNDSSTTGHQEEGSNYERANSVKNAESCETSPRDTGICEGSSADASVCDEEGGHRDVYRTNHDDTGLNKRNKDMFKSCLDLASQLQDVEQAFEPEDNHRSPKISSSCGIMTEDSVVSNNSNCRADALKQISKQVKVSEASTSVVGQNQEDKTIASDGDICNADLSCEDLQATGNAIDESVTVSINERFSNRGSVDFISNDLGTTGSIAEGESSHPGTQHNTSELGFELSLCGNLLRHGMGWSSAEVVFQTHRVSEEEFKASGQAIIRNRNLIVRYKNSYLPWDKAAYIILGKAAFGSNFSCEIQDSIPVENAGTLECKDDAYVRSPSSRWRLWPIPFRRAASLQHSDSNSSSEEFFLDSECGFQSPCGEHSPTLTNKLSRLSPRKQLLRTYIPTTDQIASLNLKDGQNSIAFSFSTRVLGKQEVDAHIYLWKWNARIVISDVDGTITKSDVLGQVMPLVGRDWSQSGVAGLFSAIKENGYQLLFLSARAIVQAYLTRSFLLNLKQDGKALPSGPVVISPDGLFPSLFREVIRRAPHEFKIACLEDIKALFPSDYNPFYAGFGNRDTDELSYRKIGIPKGKIFIINPKGEVAINNCIDVKSYTSLHTLVNDMFPPTSLVEQEDFNSWNYWKMPVPIVD